VLGPFLESAQVGAILVNVNEAETASPRFFTTTGNPLRLDGYATNNPVCNYLHGTYGSGKGLISAPFKLASRSFCKQGDAGEPDARRVHLNRRQRRPGRPAEGRDPRHALGECHSGDQSDAVDDIAVRDDAFTAVTAACTRRLCVCIGGRVALAPHPGGRRQGDDSERDSDENVPSREPAPADTAGGGGTTSEIGSDTLV